MTLFALAGKAQENVDVWFEQANKAYTTGNYDSAKIVYEKILAADTKRCRPTWPSPTMPSSTR